MSEDFNVVVIGSGPGGYAAAIRCAQKGASVALVEKAEMGGTCLNRGCIPSKVLLSSAHFLRLAEKAELFGVQLGPIRPNWAGIQTRKEIIVAGFRKGLDGLLKSNKVKIFEGRGIAEAAGKVRVESGTDNIGVAAESIILAPGSEPTKLPATAFNGETIISSTEALGLAEVPKSMAVIGGGVIGCELACVYAAVGTKVTIIEALSHLLPGEDRWAGQLLARELQKQGIEAFIGQKVVSVETSGTSAKVSLEEGKTIEAEKVLMAVGRRPVCDAETIDALGLKMNGPAINVNDKMQTSAPGVYAIGDVVGTTFLAHGAFAEAEVAATNALGGDKKMGDYSLIPRAVYTFPEVASVGMNGARCAQAGIETVVGRAFFRANGRSAAHNETVGEVRVIKNKTDERILGVTIVGAAATEMISTARALIGSTEEVTDMVFAHPTVSEVLKEAAEDAFGLSLHTPPGN
ncbi:MAG TPA: dihydrolipoyl dehydrogenase [Planctomycetes bacterium]|nr:dihydrolipoyl dehydrogenase [Planctomycetota bacterium]